MSSKRSRARKACISLGVCALMICILCGLEMVQRAEAQVQAFPNTPDMQVAAHTLRLKAPADECWAYLGPSVVPLPASTDPTNCAQYATDPPAKPKVNQSYIWGMAETGDYIWFGTFANGNCVTQGGSTPSNPNNPNGSPSAYATDSWVCEYYDSPYYPSPYPDARIGDARPPRAYRYNKVTHEGEDMTPRYDFLKSSTNPEGIFAMNGMRGVRAAVVYNDVVILAGPHLSPLQGLIFVAWEASTGRFLGAYPLVGYNNIRQFLNLNGVLYTGVGTNDSVGKVTGGAILRLNPQIKPGCNINPPVSMGPCFVLNGSPIAPANPEKVGTLGTISGSLTAHNGRICTVTWPNVDLPGSMATLYMSPAVPPGGLTQANQNQWTTLWRATDYEPDPAIAQTYAGGAIASFDGYLWWGTLHIPMQPFQYLMKAYPPTTQDEALQALAGTFRTSIILRGKDLETNPQIDLLYGNYQLPVYTPPPGPGQPGTWSLHVNSTNKKSLWGPSGLGNMWNTYTWSAGVWDNRLWLGTMDWSFTAQQGLQFIGGEGDIQFPPNLFSKASFGADLFYFISASKPAFPESTNGVDNPTTYGVRNQVRSTNGNLFLGMANAMSLLTDPADPKGFGGLGGWELIELSRSPNLNTPVGTNVVVNLPADISVTYCSVTSPGNTFSKIVPNPFRVREQYLPLLAPYDLNGPELPGGIGSQPVQVAMLGSTAVWGQGCGSSAQAIVSMPYAAINSAPRLLQMQWDGTQYTWLDITTSVDSTTQKVSGAVTKDFLGILAVAPTVTPTFAGVIWNKGVELVTGSYYVDLTISNRGFVSTNNITIEDLQFTTLGGSGVVTYNTAVGELLPIQLPNLEHGNSTVVRVYLKSSTTFGRGGVLRFTMAETIKAHDSVGTVFTLNLDQTVLP